MEPSDTGIFGGGKVRMIEFERFFKILEYEEDAVEIEFYNKKMQVMGRDVWKGVNVEEELDVVRSMGIKEVK